METTMTHYQLLKRKCVNCLRHFKSLVYYINVWKMEDWILEDQEIEKSFEFLSGQLKDMQTKIDGLENQRKEISSQILHIEEKCEFLEKNSKKTYKQIKYVPRPEIEMKEMLYKYVSNHAKTLDITLQPGELRDVYRLPNKKEPKKPTIIAELELSDTLIKNKIISAARKLNKYRKLNVNSLGIANDTSTIYLSEYLTSKARRLHFLVREFAKSKNFQFCWTSGGNVYLKKKEESESIMVKNVAQLNTIQAQTL
ncbi:unnamed protein product [Diatraea saccharalis]|uniref:FP protein C-terminal domain-containing protein n=1 Tax=Diatraea saccharalis TaxID=40085 RepID=A0A9P0C854_9NEOP|nr:unnamed protein product [Diatraea saccharalis]